MTIKALETNNSLHSPAPRRMAMVLLIWFGFAALAGTMGVFATGPDHLFRPVALAVIGPVAAFLALYMASPGFRGFVLSRDLRLVTMLQAWRVIGFSFLLLYAHGVLPGLFAWPAGLGDIAVGLSAPLVVLALARDPEFAASRGFVVWNLLGLADFVAALVVAVLASGAIPALVAGGLTSAPMEVWPLFLFPGFFVPLFIFLHLTALFQARALRRSAASNGLANNV